jgi:site-specific recombinase XerD
MAVVQLLSEAPSSPLSRLVSDYLTHCRARGLSPKTDIAYSSALQSVLLPWCAQQRIERVEELDSRTVDRLSTDLLTRISSRGTPLSRDSVHTYLRGVRQFLTWAQREGEPVAAKPQLPKLPKHHKDVLSADEINTLEAGTPSERNKLIIRLLGDCGLREGELVRLRVEDILRPDNRGQLHVRGKGSRERRVPVLPRLLRRIDRYVEGRAKGYHSDRIFLALRRDRSGEYEPLTESGVRQLVRDAGLRVGFRRSVNPHLLRHSWITEMLRQGMDPIQLSLIAGASLKVIMDHYEHLNQDDAYAAMTKALTARDLRR